MADTKTELRERAARSIASGLRGMFASLAPGIESDMAYEFRSEAEGLLEKGVLAALLYLKE